MFLDQSIIIYILAGTVFFLFVWLIIQQLSIGKLKKNQKIFFQGKTAKDLESIILEQQNNIVSLEKHQKNLTQKTSALLVLSNLGLSKVGMIRFNPFKNLGGNQSFSVAFLNSHQNGLVISSLYSNEGSRFYAKTISAGKSTSQYPLTKEEEEAIQLAVGEN